MVVVEDKARPRHADHDPLTHREKGEEDMSLIPKHKDL